MTVEQMALISKIFLIAMILLLVTAVVLFRALEIPKAWQIVVGTKLSVPIGKNRRTEEMLRKMNSGELASGAGTEKTGRTKRQGRTEKTGKQGKTGNTAGSGKKRTESARTAAVPQTTVLSLEPETMPLERQTMLLEPETMPLEQQTTLLKPGDGLQIITDITFIHTSIVV